MIFVTGLLLLALIGVPLFAVFGAAALILFLEMPGGSWSAPAIDTFGSKFAQNPSLATIPLFALAGRVLVQSRAPQRLVRLSRAWFGWMAGGLAVATLPASVGWLFPPSLPLILYGIVASLVMPKALVAGIVPGALVLCMLAAYRALTGARSPVARRPFVAREALESLRESKWELAIPVVLISTIAAGGLRVHEAAALTGLYVLIVEVFVHRDVHPVRDLPRVIVESVTMIGALLAMLVTAIGLHAWMAQAEVPMHLLAWMETLLHSQLVFLLTVNALLLVAGMVLDVFTAIALVVPLILLAAQAYDVDPYHMAVIVLLNLAIGYLTRPIALNRLLSSSPASGLPSEQSRAVVPFIYVLAFGLLAVTCVPALSTWLPDQIRIEGETRSLTGGYPPDEGE